MDFPDRLRKPYWHQVEGLFENVENVEKRHAGSWLSRLPFREMINWCRYAELIRLCVTTNWQCLRWAVSVSRALPPCRNMVEVLHLFRWFTHTHPPAGGWKIKVRTVKWKWNWREMNMRWRWKWDESYLTRTRRGERNAEGKRKTPTQGNLAQHGQTLKRQGKRKAEADGNGKGPAEGGRTDAPEPTYHSKTYAYPSTRRTQPTWRDENAGTHEIRDPWGTS